GTSEFSFNKVEEWMMKTNLFFATDIKVQNFVNLALSTGTLEKESFRSKTNLSYEYTEYSKLSLNFKDCLKPTDDFIRIVKDAKKPETFKNIIDKFGLFIPTKIILGGRVHFEACSKLSERTVESANESSAATNVSGILGTGITGASSYSGGNT